MADTAGNLRDGVHVASAAGTWMAVVYGFAGYRWRTDVPELSPMLPSRARRLRFPLRLGGSLLEVDIEEEVVTYRVRSGGPVTASPRRAPLHGLDRRPGVVPRALPHPRRRSPRGRAPSATDCMWPQSLGGLGP